MGIKVTVSRTSTHLAFVLELQCLAFEGLALSCACVQNLTKLLGDHAPGCCKEQKVENYFGRKVAVDASMHIYQFLVRCILDKNIWTSERHTESFR